MKTLGAWVPESQNTLWEQGNNYVLDQEYIRPIA
jgi:hypothetical protein